MAKSFRDIKFDVLEKMIRGDWPPGAMLPGEESLAETYGCARTTVNRALRELAEEGYLDRRRKSGTRVRKIPVRQARFTIPLTRAEVEACGELYGYRLLSRDFKPPPDWLRARLAYGPDAEFLHLACLHLADDRPFQHEDRWIDLSTLPQAREADFSRKGPNEWLVETIPFTDVEIGFSAVAAGADIARAMSCEPGSALFLTDRTTWFDGRLVTHVRLTYRPGHRLATRY